MTMDQFKSQGGALTGREERYDEFKGVPKHLGGGTAGGLGAVRGMEHTSGHHAKANAEHGDFDDTAHHSTDANIRKGGLTGNSTTTGDRGLTGGSGGLTGHHDHHHNTDRGLTGQSTTGGMTGATMGTGGVGHHDHHHNTDRGLAGQSTTGGLTGSSTSGGLTGHDQHQHADRGMAGQGNLTGSSTQGGVVPSHSGHRDDDTSLSTERGVGTGRHTDGVIDGIAGTGKNDLAHRENEDGTLPKALTEDRSKAVPHSELHDDHKSGHTSRDNTTGTQSKPSLMDKLNPKVDSNGDGKAGFMK